MKSGSILIVDDNKSALSALSLLLQFEFDAVSCLSNPNVIESELRKKDYDIVMLQKTIGDLVKVTRAQHDMDEDEKGFLHFKAINQEVKGDIYSLIRESNAHIKENFELEGIEYKRGSLRSIFYNLLSNAIKYRKPERPLEIEIKTFIQNGHVVLSVRDNGLGLNLNQQKKLFTLFRRMHQHVDGTVVGLFMIKRIVENMGGSIEVISNEGKGTEFLIYLAKA